MTKQEQGPMQGFFTTKDGGSDIEIGQIPARVADSMNKGKLTYRRLGKEVIIAYTNFLKVLISNELPPDLTQAGLDLAKATNSFLEEAERRLDRVSK